MAKASRILLWGRAIDFYGFFVRKFLKIFVRKSGGAPPPMITRVDATESTARDIANIAEAHRQAAKAEGIKLPLKRSLINTDRDGINKRARVLAAVNSTSIFFY